jgi:hypothetical protein
MRAVLSFGRDTRSTAQAVDRSTTADKNVRVFKFRMSGVEGFERKPSGTRCSFENMKQALVFVRRPAVEGGLLQQIDRQSRD